MRATASASLLTTRNAEAFADGTFAHVHVVERIPWPAHGSTPQPTPAALARRARGAVRRGARGVGRAGSVPLRARERSRRAHRLHERLGEAAQIALDARAAHATAGARSVGARRSRAHEVRSDVSTRHGLARGARADARSAPLCGRSWRANAASRTTSSSCKSPARCTRPRPGAREFRAIAGRVAHRYRTVVAASANDADLASELAAPHRLGVRIYERVGTWREALVRARAVVTPDGGAAHLAGMAGVPCVDLFRAGPRGRIRRAALAAVGRPVAHGDRQRGPRCDRGCRRRGPRDAARERAGARLSRALLIAAGGGLGDTLVASLCVAALRARYDGVDAVVLPGHVDALSHGAGVDRIYSFAQWTVRPRAHAARARVRRGAS